MTVGTVHCVSERSGGEVVATGELGTYLINSAFPEDFP